VPRRLGIAGALRVARLLHVLMVAACWRWFRCSLGALAWPAWPPSPALLIYEHSLVKADDLSRVNAAFFTMNGWVSVLFFVFWAADIFLRQPGV
jgi:4-hydroxybenzoate polyprenyltransferase